MQYPSANDCYKMNKDKYNWFLIYDMDEFIHLNNYKNIKKYLGNKNFSKCNVIYLNQILHTDNEHIYYSNKSLFERFPNINKIIQFVKKINKTKENNVKIAIIIIVKAKKQKRRLFMYTSR